MIHVDVKVRLGLVGLGPWGRRYVETIGEIPDVRLTMAVASELGERLGEEVFDGIILATSDVSGQCAFALQTLSNSSVTSVMLEKPAALEVGSALVLEHDLKHTNARMCAMDMAPLHVLVNHTHLFGMKYALFKERAKALPLSAITWTGTKRHRCDPLFDYGAHALSMFLDLRGPLRAVRQARYLGEHLVEAHLEGTDGAIVPVTFGLGQEGRSIVAHGGVSYAAYDEPACGPDAPLRRALDVFVKLIRGGSDPREGLGMAIDVTRAIEEIKEKATRV